MDVSSAIRRRLNDPESGASLSARFRRQRWQLLLGEFPDLAAMRVLDLGGTVDHWERAPVRPAAVTILNLDVPSETPPGIEAILGDACAPPDVLLERRFDLVYSNSVIEHVGGYAPRMEFAHTVESLAPRHWVQTPYRYFPVEPHWLFPGLQFLPLPVRVRATRAWPLGWAHPEGRESVDNVLRVELLTVTEMQHLFPSSRILKEQALGLCKSLVVVKH